VLGQRHLGVAQSLKQFVAAMCRFVYRLYVVIQLLTEYVRDLLQIVPVVSAMYLPQTRQTADARTITTEDLQILGGMARTHLGVAVDHEALATRTLDYVVGPSETNVAMNAGAPLAQILTTLFAVFQLCRRRGHRLVTTHAAARWSPAGQHWTRRHNCPGVTVRR